MAVGRAGVLRCVRVQVQQVQQRQVQVQLQLQLLPNLTQTWFAAAVSMQTSTSTHWCLLFWVGTLPSLYLTCPIGLNLNERPHYLLTWLPCTTFNA